MGMRRTGEVWGDLPFFYALVKGSSGFALCLKSSQTIPKRSNANWGWRGKSYLAVKSKSLQRMRFSNVLLMAFWEMPGPRFELGTRRFSVACSTN